MVQPGRAGVEIGTTQFLRARILAKLVNVQTRLSDERSSEDISCGLSSHRKQCEARGYEDTEANWDNVLETLENAVGNSQPNIYPSQLDNRGIIACAKQDAADGDSVELSWLLGTLDFGLF